MFRLGAPSEAELAAVFAAASAAPPTYDGERAGFRFDTYSDVVGSDWARACEGLRAWAAHAGAKLRITPADAPLRVEQTVVASGPVAGPIHALIPCRISDVVDATDRFGFTYITLPGHPECGEETFMLSRAGDDVVFTMSSYSRHAELLTRLGGPVSNLVQRRTNHAYIAGMRKFIDAAES